MKIPISTLILKALLLLCLLLIASLGAHLGGRDRDFQLFLFYFLPFVVALLLPPRFTDIATGICPGAVLIQLPFTLFFSIFGGIFPDPFALRVMRISSALLLMIGFCSVLDYRREGSSFPAFFASFLLSIGYVIVTFLSLSAAKW